MFKIWKENMPEEPRFIKMEEQSHGDIIITECDSAGKRTASGCILKITSDGRIYRHPCCGAKGIQTDEDGRIKIIGIDLVEN